MVKKTTLSLIFSLLFFSCNEQKNNEAKRLIFNEFPESFSELSGKPLGSTHDFLVSSKVELFDSIFAIVTPQNTRNLIHFVDKNGKYLNGIASKGKGPGEFISIGSIFRMPGDNVNVYVFDFSLQRITKLHLDSAICTKNYQGQSFLKMPSTEFVLNVVPISSSTFSLMIDDRVNRLATWKISSDTLINKFGLYPLDILEGEPSDARIVESDLSRIFQGSIGANLNKSETIVSTRSTDLIDIYNSDGEVVKTIIGPNNKGLIYNNIEKMAVSLSNLSGYVDIFISDKYIYALYSGQEKKNIDTYGFGANLFKFDLNGLPIKHYKLDRLLIDFVVYEDRLVYGLECFSNQPLVLYNLN